MKFNGKTILKRNRFLALIIAMLMLVQIPAMQIPVHGSPASFAQGSLIIPMDTVYQNTGMWKAYGLLYKLLSEGIPVSWAISDTKTFNGPDFTATTTDLKTGANVGSHTYSGGPFIISSADAVAATAIIQAWWVKYPGLPVVHKASNAFTANVDIVLRSAPRIANEETNANVSIAYYNAAGIPDDLGDVWSTNSPNILDETEIANGDLFTRGACSVRKYDIFVTPHNSGYAYSLTNTLDLGTRTYAELDYFVGQGGGWLACCHSLLSNEAAISDLYKNGSVDVKAMFKSPVAGGFLTESGFPVASNVGGTFVVNQPSMPVAQAVATTVAQALPGGAMQTWDIDTVAYYPQTERIAGFTAAGKTYDMLINGVAHNGSTLGKVTFLGGHSYSTAVPYATNFEAPYLRFFYNALFFNGAAVAKLDLTISPTDIPLDLSSDVTVELLNTGSSAVMNSDNVEIKLVAGATYVGMIEGPAPISITGNPSIGTTLSWGNTLGDVEGNTSVLKVKASMTPTAIGETQCSHLSATYGDVFGEKFTADLCRSIHVYARPQPVVSKTPETQTVNSGGIASWDLTYSNSGLVELFDATVVDVLPAGFFFKSSIPVPYSVIMLPSGETQVSWNVGDLPAGGASQIIKMKAYTSHVTVPTTFTNTVNLNGTDWNGYPYTVTDSAEATLIVPPVNLEKSVSPAGGVNITALGEELTYSLRPKYNGSAMLQNVLISDAVPAYSSYIGGSVSAGGSYGFTPLPKIDGIDTDLSTVINSITAAPSLAVVGSTITVNMTLTNSGGGSISNIAPSLSERLGSAGATISAPSITGFSLNNGASQTVTFTCTMNDIGERLFIGSAAGSQNGSGYSFSDASSNTVLVTSRLNSSPINDVVTWRLGSNIAANPGETITSGHPAGIYAFRGANTKEFSKFSIAGNAWSSFAQPTNGIEKGGSLTSDGAGTIYASEGNSKWFYKYDIVANAWTRLADASTNFDEGGCTRYLNTGTGYVYALAGNSNKLDRYNIGTNTWTSLANAPATIKKGGALTTNGTFLYALQGDTKTGFYRYDPGANSWATSPTIAAVPANVGWGGALTTVGNSIYALGGNGTKNFWCYDISGNSWTTKANTPGNVSDGGSLTSDGTYIYALQGKTKVFWRYDIAANTWSTMTATNFTGNAGQGGALVYVPGDNPQGLFTAMESKASLVTHGDTVTFTLAASSSTPVSGVTASAVTVTGTNGASAVLASGPVLISADDDISGITDKVIYEWTYTVSGGSIPGSSVTFSAHATGGSPLTTFPTASTQSVLVSPVLTFKARIFGAVDLPQTVDQITNLGMFSDNTALGYGMDSNVVMTPLLRPLLTLTKSNSPDETEILRPGDEITYTFVLKNEGAGIAQNIVLSDVIPQYTSYVSGSAVITDNPHDAGRTLQVVPPAGAVPLKFNISYLNMNESITVTFKVVIETQTAVGSYHTTNQGTVIATGVSQIDSNIVTNNFDVIASFGVTKTANPDEVNAIGETVNYTVIVYNTGDVALSSITVDDPLVTDLTYVSGDLNSDSKLDILEQWLYTGTYIIQETDVDADGNGTIVNIVTADTAETVEQTATAEVIINLTNTLLRITKTVTFDQDSGYGADDADTIFRIHIRNIDGVYITDILLKAGETIELYVPCGTYEITETAIPMENEKTGDSVIVYANGIPGTPSHIGINNQVIIQAAKVDIGFTNHFEHITYFHDSDLVGNQFSP